MGRDEGLGGAGPFWGWWAQLLPPSITKPAPSAPAPLLKTPCCPKEARACSPTPETTPSGSLTIFPPSTRAPNNPQINTQQTTPPCLQARQEVVPKEEPLPPAPQHAQHAAPERLLRHAAVAGAGRGLGVWGCVVRGGLVWGRAGGGFGARRFGGREPRGSGPASGAPAPAARPQGRWSWGRLTRPGFRVQGWRNDKARVQGSGLEE